MGRQKRFPIGFSADRNILQGIFGGALGEVGTLNGWDATDGKCNYICVPGEATDLNYPLTSKTIPFQEAYFERWGEKPIDKAARAYDAIKYILFDAIERARTIETEAVIKALEATSLEITSAKNFVFTESHDTMMGENPNDPEAQYKLVMVFQWQNEELVPIYPKSLMDDAGASYMFPDWSGPWDNIR